jgi:carbonic anhydrase/acetyltransferase-like protein (isoleucine patch superfamily)
MDLFGQDNQVMVSPATAGQRRNGAFIAPTANVLGEVLLGDEISVWYSATVDGTAAPVEIAHQANVQDNAVVQSTPGNPAFIGERVTLGHNARVFGAHIEAGSMIAIGATVLPGARVGAQSIIAANATLPQGQHVPPRSLVIGNGRVLREVTDAEIQRIENGATDYVRLGSEHLRSVS